MARKRTASHLSKHPQTDRPASTITAAIASGPAVQAVVAVDVTQQQQSSLTADPSLFFLIRARLLLLVVVVAAAAAATAATASVSLPSSVGSREAGAADR